MKWNKESETNWTKEFSFGDEFIEIKINHYKTMKNGFYLSLSYEGKRKQYLSTSKGLKSFDEAESLVIPSIKSLISELQVILNDLKNE